MLHVAIIASGEGYHQAAAWAAPTYLKQFGGCCTAAVLLPEAEVPARILVKHSNIFGFKIDHFPFRPSADYKFTSQLKCQGFEFAVSRLSDNGLVLLADADTCCLKPFIFAEEIKNHLMAGKLGMVANRINFHETNPEEPWYLQTEEQLTYVNSGIIFASRQSLDIFQKFNQLARTSSFARGRFNDQQVINYALGKHFQNRLVVLDERFNTEGWFLTKHTLIGHFLGGPGLLKRHNRKAAHRRRCKRVLFPQEASTINPTIVTNPVQLPRANIALS